VSEREVASVMVLCAGFGTRLRPLTDERPKPLVPFGDRTLLEHVLLGLGAQGLLPAVVNSHHLASVFRTLVADFDGILEVIEEPDIRGTAGGVAGARHVLSKGPVLVTNADVLANVDSRRLLEQTPPDGLCLAVTPRPRGTGTVGVGAGGRVVRLRGERFGEELEGGDYVCTLGIGELALAELPEKGCLVGDVAMPLARRGGPVLTMRAEVATVEPGDSPAAYHAGNLAWLARRGEQAFVAEGVHVAPGVALHDVILGRGAAVEGEGRLERVVAWPGATVRAPLSDAIVTTRGVVIPVPHAS
jgi:mannose-1-phosphate guanylyltransferase